MARKIFAALVLSFAAALALFSLGFAQDETPVDLSTITDDQVNAIAKQLYCPVCENIPLDVCPTQACAEWRELIRLRLAQGRSEAEIKNEFAEQYGDRVLAAPPARGLNWLVYIIPPIAILAGAGILFRSLRSMRQGAHAPAKETVTVSAQPESAPPSNNDMDEYARRLEEELRKR